MNDAAGRVASQRLKLLTKSFVNENRHVSIVPTHTRPRPSTMPPALPCAAPAAAAARSRASSFVREKTVSVAPSGTTAMRVARASRAERFAARILRDRTTS